MAEFLTKPINLTRKIPVWGWLLVLSFVTLFPAERIQVLVDGGWYLSAGLNIRNGDGYTDVDQSTLITQRGPLYPAWLSLNFWLFGTSLLTAYLATRVFFAAAMLLVYFLGRSLFHEYTGIAAALLLFSSYSLQLWSTYIHLDLVLPTVILASLYLLIHAYRVQKTSVSLFAGVVLGLAYLVKEMTILYVPFLFLAVIVVPEFRTKRHWKLSAFSLLAFCAVVSPWWIYCQQVGNNMAMLGEGAGPTAKSLVLEKILHSNPLWMWDALNAYYATHIDKEFALAPFFLVAWLVVLVRAVLGKESERLLCCVLVCFLPMMLFQGLMGVRSRQSIIVHMTSMVALAQMLNLASQGILLLVQKLPKISPVWFSRTFAALALLAVVSFQVIGEERKLPKFLKTHNIVSFVKTKPENLKVTGVYRPETKEIGDWLLQNVPEGSPILCDLTLKRAIHFRTNGKYPLHRMPLVSSEPLPDHWQTTALAEAPYQEPTLIWVDRYTLVRELHQCLLMATTEDELNAHIKEHQATHIFMAHRTRFQLQYFDQHPRFEKVAEAKTGKVFRLVVYRIKEPQEYSTPLMVSSNLPEYLEDVKAKHPEKYQQILDYFTKTLGLSSTKVSEIEAGKCASFPWKIRL